jgi:hypothetical protein
VRAGQGGDLGFEFAGLGVQGQPAAAQGSQRAAQAVVGFQGGARPPEPALAQAVQAGPQLVVGVDEEGFDLVGGLGPGLDRAAPGED